MGNFRIEMNGVGGHGCQRVAKAGEEIVSPPLCKRNDCPDCWAIEIGKQFIAKFSETFDHPVLKFTHWPETAHEVIDETVFNPTTQGRVYTQTFRRKGSF